jgi:hypothetical protein
VILVAGGTGLVWRVDIAEQLAQWWGGIKADSGSVRRAFGRVKDHGLVELVRPDQETAWRPGYLIGLTDRGAEAYRFLRGEDPARSQLAELARCHKT